MAGLYISYFSYIAWAKSAKKRAAELEGELTLLRSSLESKEQELELQRGEVERLRQVEERLQHAEQAEALEAERLRALASALGGDTSLLSSIDC